MKSQGQTLINWITLGIALARLSLAILSLLLQRRSVAVQVEQYTESGSLVEVFLRGAIIGTEPTTEALSITARNVGRLGVEVTSWGELLPDWYVVQVVRPFPGNKDVPHRLEPGSQASWWLPLRMVREGLAERGLEESEVRMFVDLGTGEHLVTEKAITLRPLAGEDIS